VGVAIGFLDLYWRVSLVLAGLPMIRTQSKVLHQLKVLEVLYQQGGSHAAIEQTLDKIIDQELSVVQKKKAELDQDLQEFEARYEMNSETFIQRFQTGSLGDDMDFVEWNAFYHLNQSLQRQIELLKSNGLSS
jgi:hypothetical protein